MNLSIVRSVHVREVLQHVALVNVGFGEYNGTAP
jgi:hypothetical protein